MTRLALMFCFLASPCLWAQDTVVPTPAVPTPAVPPPVVPAAVPPPAAPPAPEVAIADDGVRVTILGYHDFAENLPETAMRIHTSKFRTQMETIRQLGITVIPLADFVAWKMGAKSLPEKSLVLTFDDGWKSVYTDALPILREFNYPFTLYLYKNYVDGGSKALTHQMIQEMITAGATIGSHSVSHPYPTTVKKHLTKGTDAYDAFLRQEMGESKRFLESRFGVTATTYAYPGGFFTEEMIPLCQEFGYTHGLTVVPGKVKRSTPNEKLPRYMILGNYDKVFELATTFHEASSAGPSTAAAGPLAATLPTTPYPVTPEAGAIINTRLPLISADLSKVENLDPATLVMQVAGFGEVPASYDPATATFSWQVNRRLRQPTCQVAIQWKDPAAKSATTPLRWSFQIDRQSAYLPDGE